MEYQLRERYGQIDHNIGNDQFSLDPDQQALDDLLEINAEIAKKNSQFRTARERVEASTMNHPLTFELSHSYFGAMLGSLPPAAIFLRLLLNIGNGRNIEGWFLALILLSVIVSTIVGYHSGKIVGKIARPIQKYSAGTALLILPFVGFAWGAVAGAAGGIFLFIIGAFVGAVMGGLVGLVALPLYLLFFRLVGAGELIDRRHFLPISIGITLTICSFIFGL